MTQENSSAPERPEKQRPGSGTREPHSMNAVLGWIFLGLAVVLLLFMGYFTFSVVGPLTKPSPFFDKLTETYYAQSEAELTGKPEEIDELTVNLALILEYANADIRTAGVQVAFSLVAGLFFTLIGVLLLAAGISGSLDLVGRFRGSGFRLATAAPGVLAILLGGCIVIVGVYKDVSRPLDASVRRALGMSLTTGATAPPLSSEGEPPAKDQKIPD